MSQDVQSHGMVIALSVVFTLLALSFVVLRIYARRIKGSSLATDDYLILASAVSVPFSGWSGETDQNIKVLVCHLHYGPGDDM